MNSAPASAADGVLRRGSMALAIAALVALVNAFAWGWLNPALPAPDIRERIAGLAYNAFQRHDSPLERRYPSDAQIEADLRRLAALSDRLRTYSASELPGLAGIAERLGWKLTAGVWLDGRDDNNEREMQAMARAIAEHRNVERIVAGNETLLRGTLSLPRLTALLDRLQRLTRTPVSTAEPWHIWLRYPALARHVDFITVHLLPYWEGVPAEHAVDYAFERLAQLRARFPGKPIVVGEIGWPSGGDAVGAATATAGDQALFMRRFLARVRGSGLDYFVMEAVDQPWKARIEGRVGAHWGLYDAAREAKFGFVGPLQADPRWRAKAAVSSLLGFALAFGFAFAFARLRLVGRITFAVGAQVLLSLGVALAALPLADYLRPLDWALLVVLAPVLLLLAATLLAQGFEFAELFWPGSLARRFEPKAPPDGAREPFVSIHLACRDEPPEMVIASIDSLRALAYGRCEVIVVSNNTRDEAVWRPIEAHLKAIAAENLRFFHLDEWPGFKAGALNFALARSDPRAEIIAVVDADYVVRSDWLRSLVGHFDDATVAVVQSPQAHRGWGRRAFGRLMNWEYDGFFRIGMHHRNERDAIIQHGTMTLIRAAALRAHGRWSEWCLCEDTELGLRLLRQGLRTVYVDRVYGEGLVPDDFAAYKQQRRRWAQGAMQILKAHRRALLGPGPLALAQRYHFVAGWLPWIGDALHLVFSFAAMAWTIGMIVAPGTFRMPLPLVLAPLAVLLVVRFVSGPLLYWRRVPCSVAEIGGAALAGMGLSHAVARGVIAGLLTKRGVFRVTRKGRGASSGRPFGAVFEEAAMLLALAVCIGALAVAAAATGASHRLWTAVLVLQSLPYLAAIVCEALSRAAAPQRTTPAPSRDAMLARQRRALASDVAGEASPPR